MKKYLSIILGTIGWCLFGLLLYHVGVDNVLSSLKTANLFELILGTLLFLLSQFLRGAKWYLHFSKYISLWEGVKLYLISLSYSIFSPLRTADFFLMKPLKENYGIGYKKSSFFTFFDKIFDLSVIVIFALTGFVFLVFSQDVFKINVFIIFSIIIIGAVIIFFLGQSQKIKNVKSDIAKYISGHYKKRKIFAIGILSLVTFIIEITGGFLIIHSIAPFDYLIYILIKPVSMIIGMFSMIPSGIGIESLSILYFLSLFDISGPEIAAAILFARILTMGAVVLMGQMLYWSTFLKKGHTTM